MKNKEKIQILENRLNIQSKILDKIIAKLELDNKQVNLKQLDQSIFEGLDEKWRFAAVDSNSDACVFDGEPELRSNVFSMTDELGGANDYLIISEGYDIPNWKNSLIERETVELTGSDLARAMLKRGDKIVTCAVSDTSDDNALNRKLYDAITLYKDDCTSPFESSGDIYEFAVPVNSQGEPLTSSDVGL